MALLTASVKRRYGIKNENKQEIVQLQILQINLGTLIVTASPSSVTSLS
jgi:hypothetical protein